MPYRLPTPIKARPTQVANLKRRSGVFYKDADVNAFGLSGTVVKIELRMRPYTVWVRFEDGTVEGFLSDGRARSWHRVASLVLVSAMVPSNTEAA